MSLFHKLSDVYFDAVKLREELERIPPQCDCGDAEAHLSGLCCCAGASPRGIESETERRGCLAHVEKLSRDIEWFEEDLQRERGGLRSGEGSDEVERRLFVIDNLVDGLRSTVGRIRIDLMAFQETCAHDVLARMKSRSKDLEKHIFELNKVL